MPPIQPQPTDPAAQRRRAELAEVPIMAFGLLATSVAAALVLAHVALSEHITGVDVALVAVVVPLAVLVAVIATFRITWILGSRR